MSEYISDNRTVTMRELEEILTDKYGRDITSKSYYYKTEDV